MATVFKSVHPATGTEGPEFAQATPEQLDAAVRAAHDASRDPRLADRSRRAALLRGIADGLRARADELVGICEQESGLPADPRLRGELGRTCGQLEAFAAVVEDGSYLDVIIDHADPAATPPRPDLRRMLEPLGPVAVFGASNFPLAFSTAGGDTASALAAGCPVVVKGHPSHPATGALVGAVIDEAIAAAGVPAGTFSQLPAADHTLGEQLVDHPLITAVAFTGSTAGGRAIHDRAAARPTPIPVFAEMGSLNPLVVTPGAAAARATEIAEGLAASVATFGGQLCTKPGLVFVPAGADGDALASHLAATLDARGEEVLLGPAVLHRLQEGLAGLGEVERLTASRTPSAEAGVRHAPVVLQVALGELGGGLVHEQFGPVVVLVRYPDLSDLPPVIESLGGQLSLTLHAEPAEHPALAPLVDLGRRIAGRVLFGGFPTGVAVTWSMTHGGPWPAASAPQTSVGMTAIERFLRPVTYQSAPDAVLPPALQEDNPLGIWRRVDGVLGR